jgi:transposase
MIHADVNAAINIALRAPVNVPIVANPHFMHSPLALSRKPTDLSVGS